MSERLGLRKIDVGANADKEILRIVCKEATVNFARELKEKFNLTNNEVSEILVASANIYQEKEK
ncbi:MAG: hypothetical protein ABIR46_02240 [Candidatus Saccharimonadales bacterium]